MKTNCLSPEINMMCKLMKTSDYKERVHKAFPKSVVSNNLLTNMLDIDLEHLRRRNTEVNKVIENARLAVKHN